MNFNQRKRATLERQREVALKKANNELRLADEMVTVLNEAKTVRKLRQKFAMTVLLKQVRTLGLSLVLIPRSVLRVTVNCLCLAAVGHFLRCDPGCLGADNDDVSRLQDLLRQLQAVAGVRH